MKLRKSLIYLSLLSTLYGSAYADGWPDALPDNTATQAGTEVVIDVLSNDVGEGLTLTKVNDWSLEGGRAVIDATNQTVKYTPRAGFTGNDSFWYDFTDNQGRSNAAKVSVFVTASGNPTERPPEWPTANADTVDMTNTSPISISVLSNDVGLGLSLTSVNEYSANGGKVKINDDQMTVTYESLRPIEEWPYVDEFWYVFTDNWGRKNAAKVTVKLAYQEAPEAWPTANPDNKTTFKNTATTISVLDNDVGEGLSLKSVNTSSVQWGTVKINGDALIYTPRYDFTGQDEFWYVFEDAWGRTNSSKVSVTVGTDLQVASIPLNDTGITTCGNYTDVEESSFEGGSNNDLTDCFSETDADGYTIPANQDATTGRDVTNNDDSDGHAGFSFTKLDTNGEPLAASATSWACVKDNVTGLIWESKQGLGDGVAAAGLHSADDTYYWYTTDENLHAGVTVVPDSTFQAADSFPCFGDSESQSSTYCTTEEFANRVNSAGLCGINSWRVPSPTELTSLVMFDSPSEIIDKTFFPNTKPLSYATNTIVRGDYSRDAIHAKVDFGLSLFLHPFYDGDLRRLNYLRLVSSEAVGE